MVLSWPLMPGQNCTDGGFRPTQCFSKPHQSWWFVKEIIAWLLQWRRQTANFRAHLCGGIECRLDSTFKHISTMSRWSCSAHERCFLVGLRELQDLDPPDTRCSPSRLWGFAKRRGHSRCLDRNAESFACQVEHGCGIMKVDVEKALKIYKSKE